MPETAKEAAFSTRYDKLNDAQKKAVDTVFGPVMVIAGPGTGKTEVLSMRIARLLLSEAQVQPQEILCLTYTDEATNAMRRRLVQIIGAPANKVQISTFHGFCNSVIQAAPDYFAKRSLQPITDLERAELMRGLLDDLPPGHPLRRLSGNIYYDIPRLSRLFEFMKKEAWTAEQISKAIDKHLDGLYDDPAYRYTRKGKGYEKGDLKQALVDEEKRRMEATRAAAQLFDGYLERMKAAGRYDFSDMILWVLQAFKEHPALLESYQERFQFILVDEFQDTNGAQSELLYTLTQYWEDPNIFVVGDDDQSIYEFQGARLRNIIEFYERCKEAGVQIIVLKENYRSTQAILDKATASIGNNLQRLIYQLQHLALDKNIVSKNARFAQGQTPQPIVRQYPNPLQEAADIVLQIEALKTAGAALHEVAVIYAQHKQAEPLITLMERKGLPYCVKRPVNVLELPLVQNILNIFRYLERESKEPFSAEAVLFEILHAPWFGIAPTDLAQVSLYLASLPRAKRTKWRFVLNNPLLLEANLNGPDHEACRLQLDTPQALHRAAQCLENWLQQLASLPLPLLLEKILYEAGIVDYLLHGADYVWDVQVLHTFFSFVREACVRAPRAGLKELLLMIEQMNEEGISLPAEKVIQQDNGVRLHTAHGAKGAEFEHVFLLGCTANFWEKKSGNHAEFKLPPTVLATVQGEESSAKEEVARRLFYVALTRARQHLHVSYSIATPEGKELAPSMFMDEISTPEERLRGLVSADEMVQALCLSMLPVPGPQIELANAAWIERTLQGLTMSYTNLSKYLRCPLAFYYECILKVPSLKSPALGFGIAVHHALEHFFDDMLQDGKVFPPKEKLIRYFEQKLFGERESMTDLEYQRRLEQGRQVLAEYYERNIHHWTTNVLVEQTIPRYMLDGVPVTGKVDKLEFDGNTCLVVDYKTGDPDRSVREHIAQPGEKYPKGGDYWRQMVFYKLLIENAPDARWHVRMGRFEYVEPGRTSGDWKTVEVPIFESDEQFVRTQLRDAYSRIMNHEFDTGCGKDDCHWCSFARKYELLRPVEFVEIDDV
jgi:DNA helicase-2/ATP-dependent DNA helicase PcrA